MPARASTRTGALPKPTPTRKRCSPRSTRTSINRPARSAKRASRSEEHTSELQSLMRISYAVFCLKKKKKQQKKKQHHYNLLYLQDKPSSTINKIKNNQRQDKIKS